jgi:hypothetical protein
LSLLASMGFLRDDSSAHKNIGIRPIQPVRCGRV